MTSYTVDYSRSNDPVRQACRDVLDYVGPKVYKLIVKLIKQDAEGYVNMAFMMQGVSGYPCHAMWRRYNLKAVEEAQAAELELPKAARKMRS